MAITAVGRQPFADVCVTSVISAGYAVLLHLAHTPDSVITPRCGLRQNAQEIDPLIHKDLRLLCAAKKCYSFQQQIESQPNCSCNADYRREHFNFLESFMQHMLWGILPALLSGFVAYQMDAPTSDSETFGERVTSVTLRFLGWRAVAVIIMLYATDNLTIEEPNLRFTLVGTAFFVVGRLGACARFKSAKTND